MEKIFKAALLFIFCAVLAVLLSTPASAASNARSKSNADYSIAYINDFEGECEVKRKGEDIGEAVSDLYIPLYEGDTIITDADGKLEVVFDDSTIVKLDENSRLVVRSLSNKTSGRTMLELLKGRVMAIVKKLLDKEEFSVKTKMAMAAVKGTEFIVDAGDDNKVGVYDGAVEVSGLDMGGNVLHKIILNKDQETIIEKRLRRPDRARPMSRNFVKRYKEITDLREKIKFMRDLRHRGNTKKYKLERRLKRIENLRRMMNSDPGRFNALPPGQKALVNEIMKEEPYLEAQQQSIQKREKRTSRLKAYLHKRKTGGAEEPTPEETPEQ